MTSSPNLGIIIYKKYLTDELAILRLKPEEGNVSDFQAGQYVSLGVDLLHDNRITYRAYSIASPPEEKGFFEFYIKMVTEPLPGKVTSAIFNLKERDRVYWCYPDGFFTIEEKKNGWIIGYATTHTCCFWNWFSPVHKLYSSFKKHRYT
jgi:ferredoxin/flavodoxin---NADP+ reductase